jgi:hypothetical protein
MPKTQNLPSEPKIKQTKQSKTKPKTSLFSVGKRLEKGENQAQQKKNF